MAIGIGENVLEVGSWGDFSVNGVHAAQLDGPDNDLFRLPFRHIIVSDKERVFYLDHEDSGEPLVHVKAFKDMVSVKIMGDESVAEQFSNSTGILGQFGTGLMVGRDGTTVFNDVDSNAFGQEWQVRNWEEKLFQRSRAPQHPRQKCKLPPSPSSSALRGRRLGETVGRAEAEEACKHWGQDKALCVNDIIATGDLELAQAGGY